MANIFHVERTDNKITLGTTDTTINIASHTASQLLGLDASKNLESTSSPTLTGLTITESGANDATFAFNTANHGLNIYLDESSTNDELKIAGQTASKNTTFSIEALDGENAVLYLLSGNNFGYINYESTDRLIIANNTQDKDILLQINDGGATKTITWDADVDKLKHSAGTFDFDNDHFTTTGNLTAGNYTAANLLTACANNAGALDFSAASKTLTVEDNATVSQDYSSDASPQFTGIELGHASDTTLTRVSAGVVAIEGTNVAMVGGAHHDGFSDFVANEHIDHTSVTLTAGTGLTGGGDISANRTFAVDGLLEDLDTLGANSADSEFLVGTGAGALAWENAATARTSLGLVIGTDVLAEQTIGIADDNLLEVDDADATDNDYAKFTANGLEGRNYTEVLSDLGETTRTINLLQSDNTAAKQAKIDAVGKYIPSGITITFQFEIGGTHTETDTLNFKGFFGGGLIFIQGNTAEADATILHTTQDTIIDVTAQTTIKAIWVQLNFVQIYIRNLRIDIPDSAGSWGMFVQGNAAYTQVRYSYILGAGTTNATRGIEFEYDGGGLISKNYVSNMQYGIVSTMSQIVSSGNDETGTDPLYGLWAKAGGIICKSGTQPTGSTADELVDAGGLIV